MTDSSPDKAQSEAPQKDFEQTLQELRRKEGTWVEWGRACQRLQKAGYGPQRIFEQTGFEPIQQNQIVVAAQVYDSIDRLGMSDRVRSRFERTGSDTLYEFRVLTQPERVAAAELVVEKGIDSEGAREVAKAIKDYSRLGSKPEGFSDHAGDAVAYQYWKLARQQSDLQARSRLIGQAFQFVHSETARKEIEKLLTDFTVKRSRSAPLMPFYRLDSEEELPRVLPVVGRMPLPADALKAVPLVEEDGPFRMVKFSGTGAWVGVPGWQVILNAEDPVVILVSSDELPTYLEGKPEEVLVIVDRAQRQWSGDSYFMADLSGELQIQWFEEEPNMPLLGRVVLLLRPKKVLDEEYTKDPWQVDE